MSTKKKIRVGVLDIQGSVEEHLASLKKLSTDVIPVKTRKDLAKVDGFIIPGGESTTIGKLMKKYGLDREIRKRASLHTTYHIPHTPLVVWGTCAGAILLAKKVYNRKPDTLRLMDIEIERNAYGRQRDSFQTDISVFPLGKKKFPAVFIRAPRVKRVSHKVKILAQCQSQPVMLEQHNLLATMFHPELTEDSRIHNYFVNLVRHYAKRHCHNRRGY